MNSKSQTVWVNANWPRITGLAMPDTDWWMLRDVPLARSTVESMKRKSIVTNTREGKRQASLTECMTTQMTYQAKQQPSVTDPVDDELSVNNVQGQLTVLTETGQSGSQ
jgi:hypothetical protein